VIEEWEVNLWSTDNSMLIGDVGEAIALHYLSNRGFFIVTRPLKLLRGKLFLISAHYQLKPPKKDYGHWLTDKQREYIENSSAWDYVAFKYENGLKISAPYLIEVKTIRGEGRPHKKPESVSKAKSLGFKPMLVIIRLLEDWDIFVEAFKL